MKATGLECAQALGPEALCQLVKNPITFKTHTGSLTSHAGFCKADCSSDRDYNPLMERKVFWIVFIVLGLIADFVLPLWWALAATIPIVFVSWWVAYRSDWF